MMRRPGAAIPGRTGLFSIHPPGRHWTPRFFYEKGATMHMSPMKVQWFFLALPAIMVGSALHADDLVVDTLDDTGPGSLRAAIESANAEPGAQVIVFDPSVHGGAIVLQSSLPEITDDIEIIGPGAEFLSINGNNSHQIMSISAGATAVLSGLTLAQGSDELGGGAIVNEGDLTLEDVALIGNKAEFGGGGAIDNVLGTLTLIDTVFAGNEANFGGALSNFDGSVLITHSTLTGNTALQGGAIDNSGQLVIEASTLDANQAEIGGGIENVGSVDIINSTFSGNQALDDGGAIDNFGGSTRLLFVTFAANEAGLDGNAIWTGPGSDDDELVARNVIISGDGENDCYIDEPDSWTTGGQNLAGDPGCTGFEVIDIEDLQLGPLADNGGPTLTHALGSNSLALDAANDCTGFDGQTSVGQDQRGTTRPQGEHCDVGAYERIFEDEKEDVIFADRFQGLSP